MINVSCCIMTHSQSNFDGTDFDSDDDDLWSSV